MNKLAFILLIFLSQQVFADTRSDTDALFNWAETQYPELFSPTSQTSQAWDVWYFRYYPTTNNYVGINTNNEIWVLGDAFGGMMYINTLQALLETSGLNLSEGLSGEWSGTATSSAFPSCTEELNGNIIIDGNSLTGTGSINGNCISESGAIQGSVDGNTISFSIVTDDNITITFNGTISNDQQTIAGTFSSPGIGDIGTWSLSLQ